MAKKTMLSLLLLVGMYASLARAQYLYTITNTVNRNFGSINDNDEIAEGGFVHIPLPCSGSATSDGCTYTINFKVEDSVGSPSILASIFPSCGDYADFLFAAKERSESITIPEDGDDGDYSYSYTVSAGNIAVVYVENDNTGEDIYFPTFQVSFSATVSVPDLPTAEAVNSNMTAYLVANPQVSCSSFNTPINEICVGEGNTFRSSLPCPSSNIAPCAYRITVNAQPWVSLEGLPDVNYIVFPKGEDYNSWNLNVDYSAVASSFLPEDAQFDSGWFAVPPGETFVFEAYNDNYLENMYLNGVIVSYPNVDDPAADTQVSTLSDYGASQYNLSSLEMIASGFAFTLYDEKPFSPPSRACLTQVSSLVESFQYVGIVYQQLMANSGNVSAYPVFASQINTYFQNLISSFQSVANACSANACPGYDQVKLLDVCDYANDALEYFFPQIKFAEGSLELLVDGYDLLVGIRNYENADTSYEEGASLGRIVSALGHLVSDMSSRRRSVDAPKKHKLLARAHTNVDLRRNDGKVRTIAEWQKLTQSLPRV